MFPFGFLISRNIRAFSVCRLFGAAPLSEKVRFHGRFLSGFGFPLSSLKTTFSTPTLPVSLRFFVRTLATSFFFTQLAISTSSVCSWLPNLSVGSPPAGTQFGGWHGSPPGSAIGSSRIAMIDSSPIPDWPPSSQTTTPVPTGPAATFAKVSPDGTLPSRSGGVQVIPFAEATQRSWRGLLLSR